MMMSKMSITMLPFPMTSGWNWRNAGDTPQDPDGQLSRQSGSRRVSPELFVRLVGWAVVLGLIYTAALPSLALSQTTPARVYRLESVELRGTTRLSVPQLQEELGLQQGTPLDDALLLRIRRQLLGLGLFKSVILLMRKGSAPGQIKLIVDAEDDPYVLTDWALGGEFAVTVGERELTSVVGDTRPMDYQFGLVGRNLFSSLHRGGIIAAIDGEGLFHRGQIAYGLPRFTNEGTQFDADFSAVDGRRNYLDILGFGGRLQGLWSRTVRDVGEFQYGVGMYVNKKSRFEVPEFPRTVAGPKFSFYRETRLRGFFTRQGYRLGSSLLLDPQRTEVSVTEFDGAYTFQLWDLAFWTLGGKALTVGVKGVSLRGETRFDIPIGKARPGADQAAFFLRLRHGSDHYRQTNLVGSAGTLGFRYHSSGFIAELAIKVTKTPEEFAKTPLQPVVEASEDSPRWQED